MNFIGWPQCIACRRPVERVEVEPFDYRKRTLTVVAHCHNAIDRVEIPEATAIAGDDNLHRR